MDVLFAVDQYETYGSQPPFELATHPPLPPRGEPFQVRVPKLYLPWDARRGIIALRRPHSQLALCRCGYVLAGIYLRVDRATELQVPVALKVMDRRQVLLQRDDVENEVRVMALLQMGGVDAPLGNPHMVRWEYAGDAHNQYIATEFVANGSLVAYAHARIRQLMVRHLEAFLAEHGEGPSKLECVAYVYRGAGHEWMRESLRLFLGLMRALTYMHAQSVAHLDLDVYNIAVDKRATPRIIDLGSSQILDHRGLAAVGDVNVKFKPTFVAPEVRKHSRMPPPRPGFHGASADMWAAGVVLVQCLVWGFRGGPAYLTSNANWRREVFTHIDGGCDSKACHLCLNFISIPPLIGAIVKQLLHIEPHRRPSAYEVAVAMQENHQVELFPPHPSTMR